MGKFPTTPRMSLRTPFYVAAAGVMACMGAFLLRCAFVYLPGLWKDPHTINYCVACIPVALTILIAFVPDLRRAHMGWRIGIVGLGIIWSALLWRQLTISDAQTATQIRGAVSDAVTQSDKHTDEKIGSVQKDVGALQGQVQNLGQSVTDKLDQATDNINTNIGKVGKPDPPPLAKLQASLWHPNQDQALEPVRSMTIEPNADGSITAQFLVRNISATAAEDSEVWLLICEICTYAMEPEGFEKPARPADPERYIHFGGSLNPGVAFKILSVTFKAPPSPTYAFGLTVSCKNCGKIGPVETFYLYAKPSIKPPE